VDAGGCSSPRSYGTWWKIRGFLIPESGFSLNSDLALECFSGHYMAAKKIMTMLQASALQKQSPTFHAGSSRSWRFASFGSGSKCQINPDKIETSQNQAFGGLKRKWTKWTLSILSFPNFLSPDFINFMAAQVPDGWYHAVVNLADTVAVTAAMGP